MRKPLLVLAIAVASLAASAHAQGIQGMGILALDPVDDGNTVLTVTGTSTITRQADVAMFTAGVTTTGATAEEALRANARQMQAVLAAARRLDIAEKDIQTNRVAIVPVFESEIDYPFHADAAMAAAESAAMAATEAAAAVDGVASAAIPEAPRPPRIIGYRAANSVAIKQRKIDDFGTVIDSLVGAGANSVEGPNFILDDSASTEDEVRNLAIADARRRAELYAAAAGLRVVRIVMIDEGRTSGLSSSGSNSFGFMEAMAYDAAYMPTPIASGELAIVGSMSVMFELAAQ